MLAPLAGLGLIVLTIDSAASASPDYCAVYAKEFAEQALSATKDDLNADLVHDRLYHKCLNMDEEPALPTAYTETGSGDVGRLLADDGQSAASILEDATAEAPTVDATVIDEAIVKRTAATEDDPLYSRFAYSTSTGPTARNNPADNHISLVIRGDRSVRRRIHPLGARDNWAASWHRPVFDAHQPMVPGLRIESVTAVWDDQELRIHRVIGAPHGTRAELTGWATDLPSALVPIRGWTDTGHQAAPQGTAFTTAMRLTTLVADIEGTVTLAAVAVLGGTFREADWDARVDEVLRYTLDRL